MTSSGKTGLIANECRFDVHQKYMNELLNVTFKIGPFNDLSGLRLLAAFPKHGGDPYDQSGAQIEL